MTDVSAQTRATDTGEAPQGPPRLRRGRDLLIALLVALLVGVAVGRFVFATSTPAALPEIGTATGSFPLADEFAKLQQRVEAQPDDITALQELASVATNLAFASGDPSNYAIARQALEDADAIEPDQPDTLAARGQLLLSLHQFSAALEVGEQALDARPDNAASLAVVVDAHTELGQYDEAAETLQHLLDVDPGLAGLTRTSYQRELRGDLQGALVVLRQAQGTASTAFDQARVEVLRAALELRLGEVDAAATALTANASSAPGLPDAAIAAAEVAVARGDIDAAIGALSATADRLPVPTVLALQTALQREDGRTADAADTAEVVRAVAQLQQSNGQVVDLEMALFEATEGDPARAVGYAEDAYAARPDNVFVADALAWARFRAGDVEGARPLVDQALRLDGATPATRVRMAAVLEAAGDTDAAREQLGLAFEEAPWTSLPERPTAAEVADRLDVEVPSAWRPTSG